MGANNEHKQETLQAETDEQENLEQHYMEKENVEQENNAEMFNDDHARSADVDSEAAVDETSPEQEEEDDANAQIEQLHKQLEEQQQRLLRLQADYDNFRRRTRQEKEDFAKYAASEVIEQLLPVLDNFGRAIHAAENSNDFDSLFKGVDMIFRQLQQVLEQSGLKEMEAVGQPFNPEYHEAVMKVEDSEHEEGIIVEELQKGYMFKDKVLRPAMVKVSG